MKKEDSHNNENRIDIKEALTNLLSSTATGGQQFVTFSIGAEEYGIDIKKVQEITAYEELTKLPSSHSSIEGILNLRGRAIPVMEPRQLFGLETLEHGPSSVIIIFKTGKCDAGIIVDKINDVLTIEDENVEPARKLISDIKMNFLKGVGKLSGGKFIILLEESALISKETLRGVTEEMELEAA